MAKPSGTILVVDDEFSILETLVEILTWEGFVVLTASDGKRALVVIEEHKPDLLLLDYMMPVMDGGELLDRLRADPRWASLPVIMMTAAPLNVGPDRRRWNALLRKPFNVTDLLRAIEEVRAAEEPRS